MGCPVFETEKVLLKSPKEYLLESLYRPWSWAWSTIINAAILAILFLIACAIVGRMRKGRNKNSADQFTYRRMKVREPDDSSKISVLVTGSNGSLGRKLVDALVQDGGYEVHCLDLFIPEEASRNLKVYSYLAADITNTEYLTTAMKETKSKAVFHVAGLLPRAGLKLSEYYRINEQGTKNVIECCQQCGVERLIYTGSCNVLLSSDKNQVLDFADETTPLPTQPLNAYTESKLNGEKAVLKANSPNLQTCVLRCSTIAMADSTLCHAFLTIWPVYLGEGKNKLSLVPSGPCCRAHILAEKKLRNGASSVAAGQLYHISGDDCFQIREMLTYKVNPTDNVTVWGHRSATSIPKWLFAFIGLLNHWTCVLTGYTPFSPHLETMTAEFYWKSYTFSSAKAHRDLGWEKLPTWKETVQDVVKEYQLKQECKKDL